MAMRVVDRFEKINIQQDQTTALRTDLVPFQSQTTSIERCRQGIEDDITAELLVINNKTAHARLQAENGHQQLPVHDVGPCDAWAEAPVRERRIEDDGLLTQQQRRE